MNMPLFQRRNDHSNPQDDFLGMHAHNHLTDRLCDITRNDFEHALWVGPVAEQNLQKIQASKKIKKLSVLDLGFELRDGLEVFPFDTSTFDLIIAGPSLHIVNDLPGALIQMRLGLKPDGVFLCALPGGNTLHELRNAMTSVEANMFGGASMRMHPMIDLQTFAGLLQRAGFALPTADIEEFQISYTSLDKLLNDLKSHIKNSLRDRSTKYTGKNFWPAVTEFYRTHHASPDGHLNASFDLMIGIGWGPAETQQKPLRPGSAKERMADVLGTDEESLPR